MFSNRVYKTAAVVLGTGTCVLFASSQNSDKKFGAAWLKAATPEQLYTGEKSFQAWDNNWDKREFAVTDDAKAIKPTATRHIIMIRHGQYNMDGTTDKERILTKLGREQARLTGERLKELNIGITKIYESTMARAVETSSIIQKVFPDVEVHATDLLREGAPIEPIPSHPSWIPPEKEFFRDAPRIEGGFRKFVHRASPNQEKDSVEVYICHANVIRYFVCRALQFPPEGWLRLGLRHSSITWITVRPNGKVSLRCLGDAGHLPPDKLTFN